MHVLYIQVSNLGTTTIANITVTDAALAGDVVCPAVTLAPDESMTCQASRPSAVTTKDLYTGSVANTASVVRKKPRLKRVLDLIFTRRFLSSRYCTKTGTPATSRAFRWPALTQDLCMDG